MELRDAISELRSLLSGTKAPAEVRKLFSDIINKPTELISAKAHPEPTGGADYYSLTFEASDLLVRLLMAVRASDWEKVVVLQHEALTPRVLSQDLG